MKMRNWLLAGLLTVATQVSAYESLMFNFGTGYRQDTLSYETAGPLGIPNIEREKEWKNLRILPAMIALTYVNQCRLYARGYADYGAIYDGKGSSIVYDADDKANISEWLKGCAGRGEVFDFNGGFGYQFRSRDCKLSISPLIGYAHNEQHLRMYRLEDQLIPGIILQETHQSFQPLWRGPWIGVDAAWGPSCRTRLYAGWEYHFMIYRAQGKDTGPDGAIRRFRHKANAYGQFAWGGINYECCSRWSFGFQANYQDMQTTKGDEVSRRKDLDPIVETKVDLKKVHWRSVTGIATVSYYYN